ncbi:uncharacterized protein [Palaemon carinicauda]|uniref:uncharacterized protein n=1 Tax=Palaemon carinicauda TaxID=392227 RepID=UPI0035B5F595
MLAVVWAMSKCRLYLAGLQHFTLKTDHRPLIPILNSYTLDAIENSHFLRLKEKISPYFFTAVWCAGKLFCVPDTFSLALVSHNTTAKADPSYTRLLYCVTSGFPRKRYDLHNSLLSYWKLQGELYADGDLVLYGARVVVPADLCHRTLSHLHDNHRGKSFLVVLDPLSGWSVVAPCKGDTNASNSIRIFCRYLHEVGVPLQLRRDGGLQFTRAKFKGFMKRWGVRHMVTSPHYPQSNGHSEAAVKSIKHLILKTALSGNIDCEDFDLGLLELRNTPNFTGRSPAQILYSWPVRSCIPAHLKAFSKEWQVDTEDCD